MELYINDKKIEIDNIEIKGNFNHLESTTFKIKCDKRNSDFKFYLAEVSRMFTCEFAEYIAEEHYILYNVENGKHYWKSEECIKTTKQLLKDFKKTFKK